MVFWQWMKMNTFLLVVRMGRSSKQGEIEGMSIENFNWGVGSFEMGFQGMGMWGRR